MKPEQIRDMTEEELEHKELELREELFNLRIQHATGQLENFSRIRQVKKDVARILTILRIRAANEGEKHA